MTFKLTDEQQNVMERVVNSNENLLITGKAGCGKSVLIKHIHDYIKTTSESVQILTPTGVAAYNVQGRTFHSYFSVDINTLKCKSSVFSKRRDIFIIDEISMLGRKLFEAVFPYLKSSRLICFSDFSQLSPINDDFVLESETWKWFKFNEIKLEKIIRQTNEKFIELLGKLREYPHTKDTIAALKEFEIKVDDSEYVYLFGTNMEKDFLNKKKMSLLKTPEKIYKAIDPKLYSNRYYKEITKIIPSEITLKVGCRVMCVKNITVDGYYIYNGCIGTVKLCSNTYASVVFDIYPNITIDITKQKINIPSDKNVDLDAGVYSQLPLVVAYGFTVFKVQGVTLDKCIVDCKTFRDPRVLYVACSRVKTPEGLVIKNLKTP